MKGAFGDDNDNDDEEMEFAQPKLMSQGATEGNYIIIVTCRAVIIM